MIYSSLFDRTAPDKMVRCGVIGTGHFATAMVTQSESVQRLNVAAVADLNIQAARQAFIRAGISEEDICVCESHYAAQQALERGRRIIVQDAMWLMELDLDVIVESTGVPEVGARHGLAAIQHGKHIVMASKETDVVVGPILHQMAAKAGVVYTQLDGDQHGLLIALVQWARELGLEVLCAGKARDTEFVYDANKRTVAAGKQNVQFSNDDVYWLNSIKPGNTAEFVKMRQHLLRDLPQVAGYDLSELTIASNATGLNPDVETLHCPALRTIEIPEVLCPEEEGGILKGSGVIDAVTSLHYPDEAGLGGGVFLVVSCRSEYSRHILATKGCLTNSRGTTALIYRPYHLCGVETPMTILCAGLLGVSTGATSDYSPRMDMVARANCDIKAGEFFPNDHSRNLQAVMRPSQPLANGNAIPFHLANGNRFKVDVPQGTLITAGMVERPQDSMLWKLRVQQDEAFLETAR